MAFPWRRALVGVAALCVTSSATWGRGSGASAEVDRPPSSGPVAWGASCVTPGSVGRYTVYGRDWAPAAPVQITFSHGKDPIATAVATPQEQTDRGGVFQVTFELRVPADPSLGLTLSAAQPAADRSAPAQQIDAQEACAPAISARPLITCTQPGRAVPVEVSSGPWPRRTGALKHYVDLFGGAERVDRTDRDHAGYTFTVGVSAPPETLVAVTGEAPQPTNPPRFVYATTYTTLPPACAVPSTTTVQTTRPGPLIGSTTTVAPGPSDLDVPVGPPPPVIGGASLTLTPAIGKPGETALARGRGFPPNAPILLRWQPGAGQWAVTARGDGTFEARVLVLPKDPLGRRVLHASGIGAAPAPYLVVPATEAPAGFDAAVFLRG